MTTKYFMPLLTLTLSMATYGQTTEEARLDSIEARLDSILRERTEGLDEVTVSQRRPGTMRLTGAENGMRIGQEELFRAACCDLGESFTTNPSVDVNYTDAATGARQIRLLGLSGTYVQMLTENLPNFRGSAAPYALGYVPGPWMKSIQVSKGASSVRNGYESITGQIDIEYLKPEDEQGAAVNLYANSDGRLEANADANLHLNARLNSEVLAHYEDGLWNMDQNGDGFLDKPDVRQVNVQNRWDYLGQKYIFHGGLALLDEKRQGGQEGGKWAQPYRIDMDTRRYEGYMKHAFVLNREHGTNIALMASGAIHQADATYGHKRLDLDEKNGYVQLLFEHNFSKMHNLSAGLSLNHDQEHHELANTQGEPENWQIVPYPRHETTPGAYAQYTLTWKDRLTVMGGLRVDHSSRYGTFVTPRAHVKWTPHEVVTLRLSAGKGYRSVRPLAEMNNLLASGRRLVVEQLGQERAWNCGASSALLIPLGGKTLRLNAEYYYTHFLGQAVVDYDSQPDEIRIADLSGRSRSHTLQVDASYPIFTGAEAMLAWRLNDVRTTLGGHLRTKPLTCRWKGLATLSYKTPLGKWQVDASLQVKGPGRMPQPYTTTGGQASWAEHFGAFEQLNVQVTRWFRRWSVYAGGENLTNRRQRHPIVSADAPWSAEFDPTLVWGPVAGAMGYVGVRVKIGRLL